MILIEHKTQKTNNKYKFVDSTNQIVAAKGYMLIFKFREWLLNEVINYRYYFNDSQGIMVKEWTEIEILEFMNFGLTGLIINYTKAKNSPNIKDQQLDSFINHYFKLFTSTPDPNPDKKDEFLGPYMRLLNNHKFIVRSVIMNRYFATNPSLKTKEGKYANFNQGHIFEGLDITYFDLLQNYMKQNMLNYTSQVEDLFFGKYLNSDNIKGSKGGDNFITNTSIKANKADLYDYKTIRQQLIDILKLLQTPNEEKIKEILREHFLSEEKLLNNFNQSLDMAIEKILDSISLKNINYII